MKFQKKGNNPFVLVQFEILCAVFVWCVQIVVQNFNEWTKSNIGKFRNFYRLDNQYAQPNESSFVLTCNFFGQNNLE